MVKNNATVAIKYRFLNSRDSVLSLSTTMQQCWEEVQFNLIDVSKAYALKTYQLWYLP